MAGSYPLAGDGGASSVQDIILSGMRTGLVDAGYASRPEFQPHLVLNNGTSKVLSVMLDELDACTEFCFSVAFITSDGLACLIHKLKELQDRGVRGRILTSNYLDFTDPKALEKIRQFSNVSLRVYDKAPFHTKGYLFVKKKYDTFLVGSSNLTSNALTKNQEWNLSISSLSQGELASQVSREFETLWEQAEIVDDEWLAKYSLRYEQVNASGRSLPAELQEDKRKGEQEYAGEIHPNVMQQEALANLRKFREEGKDRAICVAATGTGKTYLAAFDIQQCKPKRVLYLVNRENILQKSAESFRRILGKDIRIGWFVGGRHEADTYVFASSLTLANDRYLHTFARDTFDYIVVDEVHHAGADTYRKILQYFHPKFILGLTATPERTDGFNIFEFFDYNIASNIRLHDALDANLLCDFHYYGVSDLTINGEEVSDTTDEAKLATDERVRHVMQAIRLYRNNSEPVKGLIFCSRTKEAFELSQKLNEQPFEGRLLRTAAVDGGMPPEVRQEKIDQLVAGKLDYLVSVNVFNEGIDIPEVNQVLMMRPTQSAIIFVQQLGRGLRKSEGKRYLTVIDFIGNYEHNFLIPIALYGDNSLNKDRIRSLMASGSAELPGASTIDFDEVVKERIYKALDETNFQTLRFLKSEFLSLWGKLGRCPRIMDFVDNEGVDPLLFINFSGSYYAFLLKVAAGRTKRDPAFVQNLSPLPEMTERHLKSLSFLSLEFARGIRAHELVLLDNLVRHGSLTKAAWSAALQHMQVPVSDEDMEGAYRMLCADFYTQQSKAKYGPIEYVVRQGDSFCIHPSFRKLLENKRYRQEVADTLAYGLYAFHSRYGTHVGRNNFVLYGKYTRKDVCKLLNWQSDCSSTIYGYKTEMKQGDPVCPIFVTYEKALEADATTNYEDGFVATGNYFNWYTRHDRTSDSDEVAALLHQSQTHIRIMLFIKKSDDEGSDFYYVGDCRTRYYRNTKMSGGSPIVNILFDVVPPVKKELLDYLTDKTTLEEVELRKFKAVE